MIPIEDNDRRNRTIKPRKKTECSEKINFRIFGYIGSGHHQTSGDEKKKLRVSQENMETTRNHLGGRNFIKEINTLAAHRVLYLELFLKWTKKELQQMG